MSWVDCFGNPVEVSGEVTACDRVRLQRIQRGELIGDISELLFRDPHCFRAGELHNHFEYWQYIARDSSSPQQAQILGWIRDKVSIKPFFKHFKGSFKGELFDSDEPPMKVFKNNVSCKPFVSFVEETLVARLRSGAISLLGRVGVVDPPFMVLPLTVEPTKPRLCHDARYLNLWMRDMPFSLDRLIDLPRYVGKDTYQTVLDDKSGYDHILLSEDSRTYFGIQWGGWYFTYNTLPFGWKISPFVYHTTGLLASNFLRATGIPCLLYIDDRHNGELQVALDKGEYATINTVDDRHLAAARSAIFLVAYHLHLLHLRLFFTTSKLSLSLHMSYIPTGQNPADAPSRRLSHSDSKLSDGLWQIVQKEFGGREGHTCDLMALDSNSMTDAHGYSLPHFTPIPCPGSSGVNLFTQDLAFLGALMARPYVFPPMALTGPVLKFLQSFKQSCTVVVLDVFPKKYWWPLLMNKAVKSRCLAVRGDGNALLVPSKKGWLPHKGIPGDLWVFAVCF